MKSILICLTLLFAFSSHLVAQENKKNLYIEFDESIINDNSKDFYGSLLIQYPEFDQLLQELELIYQLEPIMDLGSLNRLQANADKLGNSTQTILSLKNTYKLNIENSSDEKVELVADRLMALGKIKKYHFANLQFIPPHLIFLLLPPIFFQNKHILMQTLE